MSLSALPKRLFIANRGEIARRIALTARRLGLETVALTDQVVPPAYLLGIVDRFVQVATEAPALYLDGAEIVRLALAAGCDSLHPGFGFLSEHAGFAALVEANGLIWVGPKAKAIEAMASKASARAYAAKAGVPCVRGLSGFNLPTSADGDFSELAAFAAEAGYPLLMKAAFGGGGKGMRIGSQASELKEAALRASSEAKNSFGDGSLICEQYLQAPRHIEVQILADRHGRVVAVGDRDCSLQRRHQKVLEEAPAPGLSPETRASLHAAAVNLAAAVGYDSTGTVEFLLDWSDQAQAGGAQNYFFLEMNTRLQVEHPVSEEVYGLDLVEWQLRVAAGEPLPESFTALTPRGHSIEARLYSEDTANGFFPAPGAVAAFHPALGPGLRWEIGLDQVDEVTGRFDPMIAKLVATGSDRQAALARLNDGLTRTFFAGPASNIDLIRHLVSHSPFATGPVTTHYLGREIDQLNQAIERRREVALASAGELLDQLAAGRLSHGAAAPAVAAVQPLTQRVFQQAASAAPAKAEQGQGQAAGVAVSLRTTSYHCLAAGLHPLGAEVVTGEGCVKAADGSAQAFAYAMLTTSSERQYWVSIGGWTKQRRTALNSERRRRGEGQAQAQTAVIAPVPGRVIAVKVASGDSVALGQTLFVLESMKMEFEVKATQAGTLGGLSVSQDDQVTAGQLLATWAP